MSSEVHVPPEVGALLPSSTLPASPGVSAGDWAQAQQGRTQGSPPERQTLGQLTCCTLGSHVTTGHSGLHNVDVLAGPR